METKTQLKPKTSLKSKANLAKPKKPKKKSISTLKKEADKAFSRYIRYRDGKKDVNGNWIVECITCGEWRPYSVMQNGHFMSRRHNIVRFDEENCNGQCYICNVLQAGAQYIYSKNIDAKYGDGTADKLYRISKTPHEFTREELLQIIGDSREQVAWYEKQ